MVGTYEDLVQTGASTVPRQPTQRGLGRSRALLFNFTHIVIKTWDLRSILLVHSSHSGIQFDLLQLVWETCMNKAGLFALGWGYTWHKDDGEKNVLQCLQSTNPEEIKC